MGDRLSADHTDVCDSCHDRKRAGQVCPYCFPEIFCADLLDKVRRDTLEESAALSDSSCIGNCQNKPTLDGKGDLAGFKVRWFCNSCGASQKIRALLDKPIEFKTNYSSVRAST